jgi:LysM repeat protein
MKFAKPIILIVLCLVIFGGGGYLAYRNLIQPAQPSLAEREALKAPAVPATPPDPAAPELAKVAALKKDKKNAEARELLEAIVANYPGSPRIDEARTALGEMNADIVLSTNPSADKTDYVVRAGDSLDKISRQFKTSSELIMRSNNLVNTIIQPGQHLSIFQPEFTVEIHLGEKRVVLLQKGKFFKQYAIVSASLPGGSKPTETKTKILEKAAFRDGKRVTFGSKEYAGSARWIILSQPGYTIFAESPAGTPGAAAKPPTGLGLSEGDMEELHTLVGNGLPVTLFP